MKGRYSHAWLQSFFTKELPSPDEVYDRLVKHSFEVEGVTSHGSDTVYELSITPNRGVDCLSHYGIAKEIRTIFSLPLTKVRFATPFPYTETLDGCIQTENCDRYSLIHLESITIHETPQFILDRLEAVGQRSINPIVDLSNYLMFESGHPLHAFDASKVSGVFGVRQAVAGETLVLLGGDTVTLTPHDMVITDDDTPIALAGVKGGETTKVDADTRALYIEVASFHAASVRQTMHRFQCLSDAAVRFSQGIPSEVVPYAMQHVVDLFGEYGTVTASYDAKRIPSRRQRKTGVSVDEVSNLLGVSCTRDAVYDTLERFGAPFEEIKDPVSFFIQTARSQVGTPYMWGASVSRDAPDSFDCSSLVSWCAAQTGQSLPRISINQYLSGTDVQDPQPGDLIFMVSDDETIPVHTKHIYEEGFPVSPGSVSKGFNHVGILTEQGTIIEAKGSAGEVVEVPFEKERMVCAARFFDGAPRFVVAIPVERPDISNGIDLIEEIGRLIGYETIPATTPLEAPSMGVVDTTLAKSFAILAMLRPLGFSEILGYSLQKKGELAVAHPIARDKGGLRVDLRTGMEEALTRNAYNGELLGVSEVRLVEVGSVFHADGEVVHLALGVRETLGRMKLDYMKVEDEIKAVLPIEGGFVDGIWEVPLSSVDLHPDKYLVPERTKTDPYRGPSSFPFVLRDVALFVPDGVDAETAHSFIQENSGSYIQRVNLFDTFQKEGRLSLAFRLVFQADDRTLNDDVVGASMENLYTLLKENGYEVR